MIVRYLFPVLLIVHGVLHGHGRVKLVGTLLPAPLHRLLLLLLLRGQVGVVVVRDRRGLERKFMSCSHGQEMDQLTLLASDWLLTLGQPIRSQLDC